MRNILAPVLIALFLASCGESKCEKVGNAICKKACACREGPTCAMAPAGGEGFSLTFDSESDCRGFLVTLACSMGDEAAYNDAAACLPLVEAATCTGTGAEGALSYPADMVCQAPADNTGE